MADFIRSIWAFVVVLGVLVFIHELGHYLAARWRSVHVEAFSIGFGQAIVRWTDKRGTAWKIGWLPLGGYVKLHGQERPDDVAPEVRAAWMPGRTFHEKRVGSRAIVIAAGPIANFLLAIVLFSAVFAWAGRPTATAEVGDVQAGSAAQEAGLQRGDVIAAIGVGGADTPIKSFQDIQRVVSVHARDPLTLRVMRGGVPMDVPATPHTDTEAGETIGKLGISSNALSYEKLGPLEAVAEGATHAWDVSVQTVRGIGQMLSGRRGAEELGGPLRIAQLSGQVAQLGTVTLIDFIAVLSINLGLINLLPIPVLDGGHLLFLLAEAVRGRPVPPRAQEYSFRAGLAVILTVFVFATWNDLSHLGVVRWVAGLIG